MPEDIEVLGVGSCFMWTDKGASSVGLCWSAVARESKNAPAETGTELPLIAVEVLGRAVVTAPVVDVAPEEDEEKEDAAAPAILAVPTTDALTD